MDFQFFNFSKRLILPGVFLLAAIILGAGVFTAPAWDRHLAQVVTALKDVSVTVRVTDQFDCETPTDPITRVFFDITPKEGGEFSVDDHGVVRKFDALASYEEAGLDGYFPNGTYEGSLTPLPGYALHTSGAVSFVVATHCGVMPSPAPVPVSTSPALAPAPTPVVPQESPKEILPSTETAVPAVPVVSKEAGVISTDPMAQCVSAEDCVQLCSGEKGGTGPCTNFANQTVIPVPLASVSTEASGGAVLETAMHTFFTERSGVRAFVDSDNDGITNYDEMNMYGTDPKKADSDKDGVPDGAELVAHTDPLGGKMASATPMTFEDPLTHGTIASTTLVVSAVIASAVTTDASGMGHISSMTLSGKAPANSFVTLFIYSEPIVVTIKTDQSGVWIYKLDKELPDGAHEVYTALTDTGGRVLAKSAPLPFVKEAAAVSFGSAALLPVAAEGQTFFGGGSAVAMVGVFIAVLFAIVFVLGRVRPKKAEGGGASETT